MLESNRLAPDYVGIPAGSLSSLHFDTELERREIAMLLAAMKKRVRRERRARFWRNLVSYWPAALGAVLGVYAPALSHLAARCAPWAATFLFPLPALAAQPALQLSSAAAQALTQLMLYAQLPLDGLMAASLLRRRSPLWMVCGHLIFLHALAVLCLALVNGSLTLFMRS
jgi:hypothetical protein